MVVDPLWNDLPIIIIIIIIIDIFKNSLTICSFKNILFQESPLPFLRTITIIFLDWESHLIVLQIICFYISFCFCWLFQEFFIVASAHGVSIFWFFWFIFIFYVNISFLFFNFTFIYNCVVSLQHTIFTNLRLSTLNIRCVLYLLSH